MYLTDTHSQCHIHIYLQPHSLLLSSSLLSLPLSPYLLTPSLLPSLLSLLLSLFLSLSLPLLVDSPLSPSHSLQLPLPLSHSLHLPLSLSLSFSSTSPSSLPSLTLSLSRSDSLCHSLAHSAIAFINIKTIMYHGLALRAVLPSANPVNIIK